MKKPPLPFGLVLRFPLTGIGSLTFIEDCLGVSLPEASLVMFIEEVPWRIREGTPPVSRFLPRLGKPSLPVGFTLVA